jgi:DNA-binding response OmpR family regulator
MKVLIVEDDAALGLFLQKGLQLDGHETQCAGDGEAALARLAEAPFDLVVLDLGLPRRDGVEVLTELRSRCQRTAVLVLTGRSDVEEKVKCLNLGADDCLLKPFSFHELRARCKALLRRREQFADPVLRHGAVELDRLNHSVRCAGEPVELTGKEFLLLEFLLERRGRCCSRSELLREVWQMAPDAGTNVVDVYVNYLRKKLVLGESAMGDPVIGTVRGSGYMIGGVMQAPGRKPVRSEGLFGRLPLVSEGRLAEA